MITLVTGYNNTGKTTWIYNDMTPKLSKYLQHIDYSFRDNAEKINNIFINIDKYTNKDVMIRFYEYPEHKLHPSLQSKLVEEFVKIHNEEYDVYIETHSDHIINATRVAIKQGLIKLEDVKVLFFKAVNDFVEIKIDGKGDFMKTPTGFCDEYDKQLSLLFL